MKPAELNAKVILDVNDEMGFFTLQIYFFKQEVLPQETDYEVR
jgi:hypothetical protein